MKNGEHPAQSGVPATAGRGGPAPDLPDQLDYRADPSATGTSDPADHSPGEIHADYRADPNAPPAFIQSPGVDHTIVAYDEPREPAEYNQMALGFHSPTRGALVKGWSPDDLRTRLGSDI